MHDCAADYDKAWCMAVAVPAAPGDDVSSRVQCREPCEQQQQAELASSPDSQDSLACSPPSSQDSLQGALQRKADEKRAMLRRPEYDPPCRVADGLFIGGVGAARDLEALEALGVTHVVNASPIVPCFHRKRLRYRSIVVYDDEQDDIAQHFAATSAFIAKGRRRGGVLVHCYAGQSRSSTLIMAYLIERQRLRLHEALLLVKAARPCACPNGGFMRQLDIFDAAVHNPALDAPATDEDATALC